MVLRCSLEMCTAIEKATATKALFDALHPLFATFCKKKNQDKLVESFFALIRRSCDLLNCKDYKVSNLIMIHVPDHLVGFTTQAVRNILEKKNLLKSKNLTQLSVGHWHTLLVMWFQSFSRRANESLGIKTRSYSLSCKA